MINYKKHVMQFKKKIKNSLKKEFDSEPVYKEKYQKTKIKSYNGKSVQNFPIIKYQKKLLNLFLYQ